MEDKDVSAGTGINPSQSMAPAAEGSAAQGPLVAVTFQRNPHSKQKYLEAEPKALGVTQIILSVFRISTCVVDVSLGSYGFPIESCTNAVGSVLVIVAGALALAAQNLHFPTLKACLGMQVVACVFSIFNLVLTSFDIENNAITDCWNHLAYNETGIHVDNCQMLSQALSHYNALGILIQAALVAISVTLAAYCCKVVNCCSPTSRLAVITVQASSVQQ